MPNLEQQPNASSLQTLENELSLTKQEMDEFRKLSKEEQEKQKSEKLGKLFDLQNRLDQSIQEAIKTGDISDAQKLRDRLEEEIQNLESLVRTEAGNSMQVEYNYTDPTTHEIERSETVTINVEAKLQEFVDFYKKTKIDLPADFEPTVFDIWERNQDGIRQAIEQKGFNEVLVLPANISLPDLAEKMKMQNGYWEGSDFTSGGSFVAAESQNVDKPRIVLVHKTKELTDRPELEQTLSIKGQDINLDQVLTLEDYLVFQRKYFEETGQHLDETKYTWLATKSGARLVDSSWDPSDGKLSVDAYALDDRSEALGARPSRSFF